MATKKRGTARKQSKQAKSTGYGGTGMMGTTGQMGGGPMMQMAQDAMGRRVPQKGQGR